MNDKSVIIIRERERELSKDFYKAWTQCSRKGVLNVRQWKQGGKGNFVASASDRAGIGILLHAYNEYALKFGVDALMDFMDDGVIRHESLAEEDYPVWLSPLSIPFAQAKALARWFWQAFEPASFGTVLAFEDPLALVADDFMDDAIRDAMTQVQREFGTAEFAWRFVNRTLGTDGIGDFAPGDLRPSPPVIIRHPDIVLRLDEESAARLTDQVARAQHKDGGAHIFEPGLHVFDWKTTDYPSSINNYVDMFDQATYRALAERNFAEPGEPVYFHYFGLPYGRSKSDAITPSVYIRTAGRETIPGNDLDVIAAAVLHAAHVRRYALNVSPDGVPENGVTCYDKWNHPCTHMGSRCDNMLPNDGLVRLARSVVDPYDAIIAEPKFNDDNDNEDTYESDS
jgi:hypothetical protein